MSFKILQNAYCAETLVKNSRFITHLYPTTGLDKVQDRIYDLRQMYIDSSHICYAFIADDLPTTLMGFSDDGEPSGTAGKPMLNVLQHNNVAHVLAAVVRYFGGTKLGTGGLQRAYSHCTQDAIDNARWKIYRAMVELSITAPYEDESTIRHVLDQYQASIEDTDYGLAVQMSIIAFEESATDLASSLINTTSGRASVSFEN